MTQNIGILYTCVTRFGICAVEIAPNAPIAWIVPVFFGLTALEHLSYITWRQAPYLKNIQDCRNPDRWWWFSASAGLMAVLLIQISGEASLMTSVFVFEITGMVMFCGYKFEQDNTPTFLNFRETQLRKKSNEENAPFVPPSGLTTKKSTIWVCLFFS